MKKHKKTIAVLIAVMMISLAPVRARAIVPEVTAFFACGVGWPLVATVLIAGGIGTALYWNSLNEVEKNNIVYAVRTELEARGLTLYDQFNNVVLTDNYKNYVKMAYADDGHSYVSKDVVNTIYDVAGDLGLTGGQQYGEVTSYSRYVTTGGNLVRLAPKMPPRMMASYFDCGKYAAGVAALTSILDDESFVTFTSGYYGLLAHVYTLANVGEAKWSFDGSAGFDVPVLTHRFNVLDDGTYNRNMTQPDFATYQMNTGSQNFGVPRGTSIVNATNLGYYEYTLEGVPVGELGQITVQDGEITYPWMAGIQNMIEGLGDSLTLTITGVVGDIKAWEGELNDASQLLLDDVPIDASQVIEQSQAVAQDGTIAGSLFDAVQFGTNVIINNASSFKLPDWIANRFPFSVFRDLRDTIDNFRMQVGDEAPVLSYTIALSGYPVELSIDLNMFNDYAVYVKTYLYIIGVTQVMLKTIEWFL